MKNFVNTGIMPDSDGYFGNSDGYFGKFGGKFLPSNLDDEFRKIFENFLKLKENDEFKSELHRLLRDYVGRPSPIYHAKNLSKKYGAQIYLKREDLNHTRAHKINNAVGMSLLAKRIGKTKLIAETGAGQHGVAVATAAALLQLKCDIYMGEVDIKKQKTNVEKIKILGANIISVKDGTGTLKEAVDAALLAYSKELEHSLFALGSVVGPHPFPMIVEHFQSVIGTEARAQFLENTGKLPNHVVACIGGGSNAIGMFDGLINDESVKLYGVEALGRGTKLGDNAASITYGKYGILHGFKCLFLQDKEGNTADAYSIASGLDYPGVGPKHCFLHETGRVKYDTIDDKEAISAFYELSRTEGIIPALESAHAIAYAKKLAIDKPDETILVNLSGRGDKDIEFVQSIAKCSKT